MNVGVVRVCFEDSGGVSAETSDEEGANEVAKEDDGEISGVGPPGSSSLNGREDDCDTSKGCWTMEASGGRK